MIDLMEFTNEKLLQGVELIPIGLIREFFRKKPKTLNRIKPGFRATAIPQNQYCPLLVKAIKEGDSVVSSFVASFLEKAVNDLAEKEIQKLTMEELVEIFANSLFSDCIELYYKISNTEIESGKLEQLQTLVKMYKEWGRKEEENKKLIEKLSNEKEELRSELADFKKAKKKLQEQLEELTQKLELMTTKQTQVLQENANLNTQLEEKTELLHRLEKALKDKEKEYKKQLEELAKAKSEISIKDDRINELSKHTKELEDTIAVLQEKINKLQSETSKQMNEIISLKEEADDARSALEDAKKNIKMVTDFDYKQVDPKHLLYYKYKNYDELHEEIGYKLDALGVSERRELISACIERATYLGRPIVSDRDNCELLANLLSSIISNSEYSYIAYYEGVNLAEINGVLESSGRVVYLDNFIGNFNETLLFPLLQKYNDKIVIISAMYNKMFRYLPQDILEYCSYLNFSREKIDTLDDWDPYQIEEMIVQDLPLRLENAATIVLEGIMRDLKFSRAVCEIKSRGIENHICTHAVLIYEILPYMTEVLGVNPFKISERLLNYIQKSSYRQLVEKWFINE